MIDALFPMPSDNAVFVMFLFGALFVMCLLSRVENRKYRDEIRYYRNPERRHIRRYDD